jgi:hypothetical protein
MAQAPFEVRGDLRRTTRERRGNRADGPTIQHRTKDRRNQEREHRQANPPGPSPLDRHVDPGHQDQEEGDRPEDTHDAIAVEGGARLIRGSRATERADIGEIDAHQCKHRDRAENMEHANDEVERHGPSERLTDTSYVSTIGSVQISTRLNASPSVA